MSSSTYPPLAPDTVATLRGLVRGAVERFDENLTLARLLDPGPLVLDDATFRRCVLDPTRDLLLALSLVPEREQDAALAQALVSLFALLVDRDDAAHAPREPETA